MSTREIIKILREMSAKCEWFPILDLVEIIASYVYETPTKCIQTLTGHTRSINIVVELKNGFLASGADDCEIKIWEIPNCIKTLYGHALKVRTLIQLKNEDLVSGSWDTTIRIWRKYVCMQTLTGHKQAVCALTELKDGMFASGSWDTTVRIWKRDNERYCCTQVLRTHISVYSMVELADGSLGVAGNSKSLEFPLKSIAIWRKKDNISYDEDAVMIINGMSMVKSIIELKNNLLVSGSYDNIIRIWRLNDNYTCIQSLHDHKEVISSLVLLKDGSFASGSWDHTIKIWKCAGNSYFCDKTLVAHESLVESVIELKNGLLASASDDGTIKIWE